MNYQVGKDETGRWHFYDPDGNPFFMRGIYAMTWDRSNQGAYRALYGGGDDWRAQWAKVAADRARAWRFNVASEYSAWDIRLGSDPWSCPTGLPFVHMLKLASYVTEQWGGAVPDLIAGADSDYMGYRGGLLADVFHPKFESEVERYFTDKRDDWWLYAKDINSEHMVGATIDDSDFLFGSGPGDRWDSPRVHPTVASIVVANDTSHAYQVLRAAKDKGDFQRQFADRFFKVTTSAIRRHLSGKLVFSPATFNQWGGVSRPAWLGAAGRYCDVVQVAIASRDYYEITARRVGDKPLVVWETIVANPDSAIGGKNPVETPQWPPIASSQAHRGALYRQRMRMFRSCPNIAGVSWWEWLDNPGERSNYGLVSTGDVVYREFVEQVAEEGR